MRLLHSLVTLPLFALSALQVQAFPQSFQNDAVAQTHELGGSVTTVTTTITARATKDQPGSYYLPLTEKNGVDTPISWSVTVGKHHFGQLPAVRDEETNALVIKAPPGISKKDETATVTLTEHWAHLSRAVPEVIEQDAPQFLMYRTDSAFPDTSYPTKKMTVKYRAPRKIISHSDIKSIGSDNSKAGKLVGSSLSLGPFQDVPASLASLSNSHQQPLQIHYETVEPVVAFKSLERYAEVGVWASNLNIEDHITLLNAGPKLKGHFSRLGFQAARFRPVFPAQILKEITYPLPEGASSPYYIDSIGNISTSHFRPSPSRGGPAVLEIQPRYPLLGGWEFEFTVGWDLDLKKWLKTLRADRKVLAVPFLTGLKGVVVEETKLIVTLPEGATNIDVSIPFPVDAIEHSTHKTYLDSIGRPRITVTKAMCSEAHEQDIFITYTYPFLESFRKPIVVMIACLGLFGVYWIVKRLDMSIAPSISTAKKSKTD